jgi:CRP-like cAMP-binding protein
MPPLSSNVSSNLLLNSLSAEDLDLLAPHLHPETLSFRQRIQSARQRVEHLYFPERGVISILGASHTEARQAEIAIVGREGMTGAGVLLGADISSWDMLVQVEGAALRIARADFLAAAARSEAVRSMALRYSHAFCVQCAATALANAHGTIEERLARWLLMSRDRHDGDELPLTHEFIALMLGVRRPGVTIALQQLEQRALIQTGRGSITLLDREGLGATASGLYGASEAEYERLFPRRA